MPSIDYSGFRRECTALACVLLMIVLDACGAPFTATGEALASAGDAGDTHVTALAGSGGELAAQAGSSPAGGAAPAPQGGAGGEKTTTSAGAPSGGAPNAGAGGSAGQSTVSAAGAGDAGAPSCLAGWKGSSCDECAAIIDQNDRQGCASVVDCCESKHLDCHNACTVCGCGFAYDQPAADVYACRCGGAL